MSDFSFLEDEPAETRKSDSGTADDPNSPRPGKKHKGNRYSHRPDSIRKRKAYRAANPKQPAKRGRKPGSVPKFKADGTPLRRGRLAIAHHRFIEALLKNPTNHADAYRAAFPNVAQSTAANGAYRLLRRDDIAAELDRREKLSTAKNALTRNEMQDQLARILSFDFRRFYYSPEDAASIKGAIPGAPKKPHHLDAEAAQVIESYEHSVGRYGDKVKFRGTPRLGAAELLAKLKGWLRDDGRPPITANFSFNFGAAAPAAAVRHANVVEAVPERLYGAMGLRSEDEPAKPMPATEVEEGEVAASSTMPPGYEAGRPRGVRIKSRGSELARDLESVSGTDAK